MAGYQLSVVGWRIFSEGSEGEKEEEEREELEEMLAKDARLHVFLPLYR